jgi:catechol 2,3-dioxygenase-like lactoylglutathione lyase family enzyme
MKLYGVRIWVDDLAAARRFYGETLGLPVKWDYGAAVGFDIGADLIVEQDDGSEPDEHFVGRFAGCSLKVDDIDATWRDLTAKGVEFVAPPTRMAWGGTLAHFKDPAGNVLTLLG